MRTFAALVVCCLAAAVVAEEIVTFHGHEVLRTYPLDREQVFKLGVLEGVYDFWTSPRLRGPTDIRVAAEQKDALRSFLTENKIPFEVMIEDLEVLVAEDRKRIASKKNGPMAYGWTDYYSHDDINQYLEDIAAIFPDITEVVEIGKSTQGRSMKVIRIGANGGTRKPAYFIDGGIHAREWIASATATYVVNDLLINRESYVNLLNQVDIYVLPVANPDGYEFTRSNNRMWRKTRSDHDSIWGCIGVDPNRNFDVHFGGPGTSADKCSDIYKGPAAFSEPETAAMRDFIAARNQTTADWKIYNALHSYSQLILTPWGWTNDLPVDYTKMRTLGDQAAAALTKVFGTKYLVGSVTELLSAGSGGSDDWAYGSGYFDYSYTIELRDQGRYGFELPPAQIIPTAQETLEAIKVMANSLVQ